MSSHWHAVLGDFFSGATHSRAKPFWKRVCNTGLRYSRRTYYLPNLTHQVTGVFPSSSCLRPLCTDINSSFEMRSWASMGVKVLKAAYSSAKCLPAQHLYIKEVLIRFLSFSVFCLFLYFCVLYCHGEGKVTL